MWNSWLIVLQATEQKKLREPAKALENYLKTKELIDPQQGYTLSGFLGKRYTHYEVNKGERVIMRITCLDRETFGQINMHLFRNKLLKTPIILEDTPFQVMDIKVQEASSVYVHYQDPIKQYEIQENSYTLKLLAPTTFKVGEMYKADINSKILFKNLATKYRKYIGEKVPKQVIEVLGEIPIESLQVCSKIYKVRQQDIPTVQGSYKISYQGQDDIMKAWLKELLEFATYIGIGYQSQVGWGANQLVR